jgi:hypothetical protein
MYRKELNERSPLRVFEQSIHGGLGRGNIGVAVGRHGVGKTAFLVGVALDDLMRGRKVMHVALDQSVEKVRQYYDEIFMDLARSSGLEDAGRERLEMERNRHIHTYVNHSFSVARLKEAIAFLRTFAHFEPEAVMIDGLDFARESLGDMLELRGVARELNAEMWLTAVMHRDAKRDDRGIPDPVGRFDEAVSVIISLAHDGRAVHVRLLKDHENPDVSDTSIALDPTTMLLMQEEA